MFDKVSSRFNTMLLILLVGMAAMIIAILATRSSAGPLDPPGPPASTLPQVEPRSPIPPVGWDGSSPITISSAGSYVLTRNLSLVPIILDAPNVTLDLNGFTLTGAFNYHVGISSTAGTKWNIVIRNGALVGWQFYGISLPEVERSNFSDLNITGSGTGLEIGGGNIVSRVQSHNNGTGIKVLETGQSGGRIEDSNFSDNGLHGMSLGNHIAVRDCVINSNGFYGMILGDHVSVRGSMISANTAGGVLIQGSWNDIEDSSIVENASFGIVSEGNRNVVVHNHIDGNGGQPYSNGGQGNILGPVSSGNGTNPSENNGFP